MPRCARACGAMVCFDCPHRLRERTHDSQGEFVMPKALIFHSALALGWAMAGLPCAAQDYPTRPITMMVAFAPGGFADGIARVLGAKLSERLGQNVVIENRGGAGGNIAAAVVAKAAPDGHTLLVTTTGLAINATLSTDRGFSLDDLRPVAIPAWAPETLSVHPSSTAKTLTDLIRAAKDKSINFGSPGVGTSGHIANAYMFKTLAKVEAVHVPFQGGAPALNAMLGGHIDALTGALPGYAGQLNSGQLRGLAVSSAKRVPVYPYIPTDQEAGFPVIASTWVGVFAPRGVSDNVVKKLNDAINGVVGDPAAQAQFQTLQTQLRRGDAADATAFFQRDVAQWRTM